MPVFPEVQRSSQCLTLIQVMCYLSQSISYSRNSLSLLKGGFVLFRTQILDHFFDIIIIVLLIVIPYCVHFMFLFKSQRVQPNNSPIF